jgi:hypothetical protein
VVSRLPPSTSRPVRTRFRFGSAAERLNLADDGKSPDHYAKGTRSGFARKSHSPLTACRRVVSGSLSSPCRGSSHLSLALLGSLSVAREYLALGDGPPGFRPASTCPALLRCRAGTFAVRLRDFHPLWSNIPGHFGLASLPSCSVLQPRPEIRAVWAGPLSLAATYGVEVSFSSSGY